jgi:hypothetical protein
MERYVSGERSEFTRRAALKRWGGESARRQHPNSNLGPSRGFPEQLSSEELHRH